MRIYKLEETYIATEREARGCYGFPRVYKYAYKPNKQYLRYLLYKKITIATSLDTVRP